MKNKIKEEKLPVRFLAKYLEFGFGIMPKQELDLLIFSFIIKHNEFKGNNNYQLCKKLKITPTKLKNLLMQYGLKYEQQNMKTALDEILHSMVDNGKIKLDYNGLNNEITFFIENPILRLEFEQAVKVQGHTINTSFNSEIVVIKAGVFLELLFNQFENRQNEIKNLFKKNIKDDAKLEKLVTKNLPISVITNRLLKDGLNLLSVTSSTVSLLTGGK